MAQRCSIVGGAGAEVPAVSNRKLSSNAPTKWERRLVFGVFVFLGSLIKLTQHGARELKYNFLCPILTISMAKLACSLALYARFDGPLSAVPERLSKVQDVVLRYSAVAALFCLYDVLSFVNLGIFDPQTYLVFLQMRTVISGAFWEVAFAKPLSWMQRGALGLICIACVAKQTGGGFNFQASSSTSLGAYTLLVLQVTANCCAGVCNELLLKSKGGVPLNLQNAVQYTWTIFLCLLVGLLCPIEGVRLNPFDLQEWAKMADSRMLPNIVILTVLGLVTSLLLKMLDSVWKAIATSVELFLTSYASAWVFGYPVHMGDLLALCVAALGVALYAAPGASATSIGSSSSNSKTARGPKEAFKDMHV